MATLEQLQVRIEKLQLQEARLRQKESSKVIKQIHKLMAQHGLKLDDLKAGAQNGASSKRGPGRPKAASPAANGAGRTTQATARTSANGKKSALPAKYRNPETGETWSGWARPPLWIKDVKDRSKYLIDPSSTTAITLGPRKGAPGRKAAIAKTKAAAKKTPGRRGRPTKSAS